MTPLKKEREKRGLTAVAVAAAVGATQSHYSKVEKDKAQASPALARRLAQFFGHAITEHQVLYPKDYALPEPAAQGAS